MEDKHTETVHEAAQFERTRQRELERDIYFDQDDTDEDNDGTDES
jgi:hypothetical protein